VTAPQSLKNLVHAYLDRRDRRLVYLPPDHVTGIDLVRDLRIVLGTSTPVCLDVGANRGQTIELLQRTFARPTIHAFEPSAAMLGLLRARGDGDQVHLHGFALGRRKERREFIHYSQPELSSFLPLAADAQNPFRDVAVAGREPVEVRTVDDFVAERAMARVDLLKIDTQGFDADVIDGAAASLRDGIVGAVLIELNYIRLYRDQCDPAAVARQLREGGLHLVDYYEKVRHGHTLAWCTALFARRQDGPPPWAPTGAE
jgi:FkbM family methyltransferase